MGTLSGVVCCNTLQHCNSTATRCNRSHGWGLWEEQAIEFVCVYIECVFAYIYVCIYMYICISFLLLNMFACINTANPTWDGIFESPFKAQSSNLESLFSLKRGKRDVRALSFELWNSIRKCHPKWDRLYIMHVRAFVYIEDSAYKREKPRKREGEECLIQRRTNTDTFIIYTQTHLLRMLRVHSLALAVA